MPQIATSDVTYAVTDGGRASPSDPSIVRALSVSFGNGTLFYTSGGIPLDKAKLGCPTVIQSFTMLDSGNAVGYLAKWNQTSNTVRLYQDANITAAAASAFAEIATSAAVSATTLRVSVKGY